MAVIFIILTFVYIVIALLTFSWIKLLVHKNILHEIDVFETDNRKKAALLL